MIVNAFKTSASARVSQAELASYSMGFESIDFDKIDTNEPAEEYRAHWNKTKTTAVRTEYNALNNNDDAWDALMDQCKTQLGTCNETGVPMLKGLNFDSTTLGTALSWCDIKNQVDNKRPVLFGYKEIGAEMSDTHFLVLLGHRLAANTNTPEVLVWDPLPTFSDRDLDGDDHLDWIPYADFANPGSDWGVGADHQRDRFNIRNKSGSFSSKVGLLPGTCDITQQTIQNVVLVPEEMERVRSMFGPGNIQQTLHGEAMPEPGQTWGTPFPIVGLTKAAIVSNGGSADRLIGRQTSTVLVPVLESDKIVDVFVASNDRNGQRWRKRGYASVGITRRLVEARTEFVQRTGSAENSFYLISIPYRGTFFVGQGQGSGAKLMPIETDVKLGVERGQIVAASALLGCIAGEATDRGIGAPAQVCRAH